MSPIRFSCKASPAVPPDQVAQQILDLSRWSDFPGYGVLPGIRSAEFERRTPEIVGSRSDQRVLHRRVGFHCELLDFLRTVAFLKNVRRSSAELITGLLIMNFFSALLILPPLIMGLTTSSGSDEPDRTLFDFSKPDAAQAWQPVNDGVMGGVSDGRLKITDEGTMQFFGTLSLENNGGFASVRTRRTNLGFKPDDTLIIKLKGDGRAYLLNLYVPSLQIAYSYRAAIPTEAGEWTEVRIPLKDCYATSFGNKVPNAGPLDASKVNSMGFMLADKKAGPFKLEIAWVKVAAVSGSQ